MILGIFNLNPTTVTMTTLKALNCVISYSTQIFKQNLWFFIIQDCVDQRKALFYLKILLGNNFPQFDKCPGKYTSKTRQVEQNCLYINFFIWWNLEDVPFCNNSNSFLLLIFVTKSPILNAAGVLDPPVPNARIAEQKHIW